MSCVDLSNRLLQASVLVHRCHLFCTGGNFLALHPFYGDLYEALDGWYDRLAERALADGERAEFEDQTVHAPVPSGDCVRAVSKALKDLQALLEDLRDGEEATTLALFDELDEFLGKMAWQLGALG